ncbi:MAG: zf-HC2 domain-containing protein, partial [Gemmatimonadales bacterium]
MRRDDAADRGRGPEAHVSERLDAYRTGELDEVGRAWVDAHLTECERCRE